MHEPSIRHHCGLFGIWGHEESVYLTHLGLYALQHRGQESAGIVSTDGSVLMRHAKLGLVNRVFDQPSLDRIRARVAIGHVRYSTTGSASQGNTQPLLFGFTGGHPHWNWGHDDFRKLILNAIVWTARAAVPPKGVPSKSPTLEELQANQDEPLPDKFDRDAIRQRLREWSQRR